MRKLVVRYRRTAQTRAFLKPHNRPKYRLTLRGPQKENSFFGHPYNQSGFQRIFRNVLNACLQPFHRRRESARPVHFAVPPNIIFHQLKIFRFKSLFKQQAI